MEGPLGPEVVGDSQEGQLEFLAAAMTSPLPEQQQAGRPGTHSEPETDGASPPPTARSPAGAAFAAECRRQGAEPHPQLLASLNRLEPEALAPLTLHQRPGEGGAVLNAPPDAAAQHVEALLALACMRPATGPPDSQAASQAGEPPSHYLRTVHLDLSGHELSLEQLQDLLMEAPWRLRQCLMWQGLVLADCKLQPEALSLLESWEVMRLMGHLKRLVLADNPLLGRDPAAPEQCLGPLDIEWLEGRLLQAAPLDLLDLRRTGFGNDAYTCLLWQLVHYSPTAPICEEHGGCRASLRCLKLGPPADQPHFGEEAVACLQKVLQVLPHLEAVEVLGLSPEATGALLPAWQEALQQRGQEGCTIAGEGGALRFARVADGEGGVAAERLPTEHVPLQALPPQHVELDDELPLGTAGAAGEVQQRRGRGGGSRSAAEPMYQDSQGDYSQDDEYESEGLAPSDSREEDSGSEGTELNAYRTPVGRRAGPTAAEQPARRVGASGIAGDHFSHIADDDKAAQQYKKLLKDRLEELKKRSPREHATAKGLSKAWSMAEYSFDRRRWKNPPANPDSMVTLNAFLRLNEILERNGLDYPFPPMPADKRQEVLAWRAAEQAKEAATQAQAARQAQQQAEAEPGGRHKKLRRAGEVEQDALRDEMEDGSPPVATLGTQRHKRKQQQVLLSDSESDDGADEEDGSEDSRPLALRAQQRAALRTPVARLALDSEDSPPHEQQQQQPKKQRPGTSSNAGEQQQQQQQQQLSQAPGQGGSTAAALAFTESPQSAHAAPAAYRASQLAAVAAAEAEAAVEAAVQQLRLGPSGAEPQAAAAAPVAAAAAAEMAAMPDVERQQRGADAAGRQGYVTLVGDDGVVYVPDSEDEE
ncbi:hypothetical protein C2E21_4838 [Chlorella sorokiniana]|uniref:Uncharacterized protein n=1 Tax=Chlorella sorokiniana TaxID=3076 RepID=A0A2P6TRC7_CHLSO|nr:hypothetical protein C2E21_4838 [Chlorella sorokiniana]|eukprot:PRW56615.1 hypothetical protein C2E21_4838 [Chlorella sorokiniana]